VTRFAIATASSLPEPKKGTFFRTIAKSAGSSSKFVATAFFSCAKVIFFSS